MNPGFHENLLNTERLISGRYRPKRVLGKGGMGWVVEAEDRLLDNQNLVLKFLFGHLVKSEKALSGFRSEVLIARRLIHPGIVRTHSFSHDEDFGHFIVMEHVSGSTLKDVISKCPEAMHSAEFIVKVLQDLLSATAHAHSLGVIHLDIKPENIVLTLESALKLGDFGLSQSIRNAKGGAGRLAGTPLYMAPEQFRGEILSQQTDIYAIGILLHHLVAGTPPFQASSLYALGKMHMEEKLPCLRKKRPDIPEWVHALMEKCAEKSTRERFRSVDEMILVLKEMGEMGASESNYSPTVLSSEPYRTSSEPWFLRLVKSKVVQISILLLLVWFVVFSGRRQRWLHTEILYYVMQFEKVTGVEAKVFRDVFHLRAKLGQTLFDELGEDGAVEAMIRMGAPVNLVNPYTGMTILAEVSINKLPFRFFAPLLAAGADPNIPDPRGQGPLHLVRGPNSIRMAEMLLESGAKVDLQDLNGMTPLLRAVEAEDFDLVRALIKGHANPLLADKEGRTPMSVARKLGNERIIGLLAQI